MSYRPLTGASPYDKEAGDGFRPGALLGSLWANPRRRLWLLVGLAYVVVGYLTIPSKLQRNYSDIPPFLKQERMKEIRRQCRHTPKGSPQTTDMPLAHLISSHHDESVIGAAILIEEIFDVDDVYVIHVKKGAKIPVLESVQAVFKDCRNIVWVPDEQRVDSGYADFSIVAMELVMIKVALEVEMDWVYALLMDGSSWPVMPLEERRDWFRALPKDSSHTYIRNNDGTVQLTCDRGNWKCVRTPARCANAACDKYTLTPEGSPITMGWQWVRLSRELSYWLINDPLMDEWVDFFNGTEIPDEHFFGTAHYASPYRDKWSPHDFMYVDWDHRNNCRWWPNPRAQSSPCYLSILDMNDIILSGAPFARKLYTNENELRSALPRSTVRPHVS